MKTSILSSLLTVFAISGCGANGTSGECKEVSCVMAASSGMKISTVSTGGSTKCDATKQLPFKFLVTAENLRKETIPRSGIAVAPEVYGGAAADKTYCSDSCGVVTVLATPTCASAEISVSVTSGAVASDAISVTFDTAAASLAPNSSGDARASVSPSPSASPTDIPSPVGGKSLREQSLGE